MKLPNGDRVSISTSKIVGYCLNKNHQTGKHKAKVFSSVLGITASNSEELEELIRVAAIEGEVVSQNGTNTGQQLKVDWVVPGVERSSGRPAILRTIWEIASGDLRPRLISAFIR